MKGGKKALPKIHFKALNAPRLSAEQLRMDLLLLIPSPGLRPERSPCPAGRPRAEHPRRQAGPAAGRPGRSPAARSRPARRRPPSAVRTGGEAVRRREGRAERPAGPGTGLPRGGQARRSHSPTSWSKGLVAKSGMAGRGGSARPPLRSRQRGDRTTGPRRLPLLLPPGSPSPPPPPPPPRAPEPARRAQHAGKPGPALPPPGAARPAPPYSDAAPGEWSPVRGTPFGLCPRTGLRLIPSRGGRLPGSLCCCPPGVPAPASPTRVRLGGKADSGEFYLVLFFRKSGSCPALSGKRSELRRAELVFSLLMPSCFGNEWHYCTGEGSS